MQGTTLSEKQQQRQYFTLHAVGCGKKSEIILSLYFFFVIYTASETRNMGELANIKMQTPTEYRVKKCKLLHSRSGDRLIFHNPCSHWLCMRSGSSNGAATCPHKHHHFFLTFIFCCAIVWVLLRRHAIADASLTGKGRMHLLK